MSTRLQKLFEFHAQAPEDAFTTYALGLEYAASGDVESALEWLAKTIDLDPDHAYAWYQRAALLFGDDRLEEARQAVASGLEAAQRAGDGKAAAELQELAEDW